MHAFTSKWGIKRNRASAASEKIFQEMIGKTIKSKYIIKFVQKNSYCCMLKLNIKLLIDSPKIDHGAFVAIGRQRYRRPCTEVPATVASRTVKATACTPVDLTDGSVSVGHHLIADGPLESDSAGASVPRRRCMPRLLRAT